MALACSRCGGHGPGALVGGRWSCSWCGTPRYLEPRPLLIVSGAAAAGKSTVCAFAAAQIEGILALDVDVFAAGATAVSDRHGYVSFWSYLMDITREIHQNGTDVVWCGICRPEQIAAQAAYLASFSSVELLILSCEPTAYPERLDGRPGGNSARDRAEFHCSLNTELRAARSTGAVHVSHLDTTSLTPQQTQEGARDWLAAHTGGVSGLEG